VRAVSVDDSVVFETDTIAFQVQVNASAVDILHLLAWLNFPGSFQGPASAGSGSIWLGLKRRHWTGLNFSLDMEEAVHVFATVHVCTGRVNFFKGRREFRVEARGQILRA
jgi:hypothetical protein